MWREELGPALLRPHNPTGNLRLNLENGKVPEVRRIWHHYSPKSMPSVRNTPPVLRPDVGFSQRFVYTVLKKGISVRSHTSKSKMMYMTYSNLLLLDIIYFLHLFLKLIILNTLSLINIFEMFGKDVRNVRNQY